MNDDHVIFHVTFWQVWLAVVGTQVSGARVVESMLPVSWRRHTAISWVSHLRPRWRCPADFLLLSDACSLALRFVLLSRGLRLFAVRTVQMTAHAVPYRADLPCVLCRVLSVVG